MSESKVIALTCPVCENRLRVADYIERLACLRCGTELTVVKEGEAIRLVPSANSVAEMSEAEQRLIEVNSALKNTDDGFGIGCGVATMGLTLGGCILLSLAVALQSSLLFWITLILVLCLMGFVLFVFIRSSNRTTEPLLQQRENLKAEIARQKAAQTQNQGETNHP